jgi:hypothetical protein
LSLVSSVCFNAYLAGVLGFIGFVVGCILVFRRLRRGTNAKEERMFAKMESEMLARTDAVHVGDSTAKEIGDKLPKDVGVERDTASK